MADFRIYNTLTKKKELFEPLKSGRASLYHCGPTVYDRAHIGNLRAYVFADTLRRALEYFDYEVDQAVNITDVGHLASDADAGDDKMTKALKREGLPFTLEAMRDVGTKYADLFKQDLVNLNIETPKAFPRASDYIKEDIDIILELEKKGLTYKTSDGIYFDISKFPGYGKLGDIKLGGLKKGARVETNSEKRQQSDFALWKLDAKLGWESPWGCGFPGWHIECSAMSRAVLGQPFDIHTGAIDLIPTHHNNEIAQSEAAFGVPLARYWMHNEFLNTGAAKMAKSTGSGITLESLKDMTISPLAYRYWLLMAHYRTPASFSPDAVKGAQSALIRLMDTVSSFPEGGTVIETYEERFKTFIGDDLDTPKAVALIWELLKDTAQTPADKRATILRFDTALGLKLGSVPAPAPEEVPSEITALAEAREEARKEKDWVKADALRIELASRGYEVLDGPNGYHIRSI